MPGGSLWMCYTDIGSQPCDFWVMSVGRGFVDGGRPHPCGFCGFCEEYGFGNHQPLPNEFYEDIETEEEDFSEKEGGDDEEDGDLGNEGGSGSGGNEGGSGGNFGPIYDGDFWVDGPPLEPPPRLTQEQAQEIWAAECRAWLERLRATEPMNTEEADRLYEMLE